MLLPEVLLLLAGHPSALFRVVTDDPGGASSSAPAQASSPFGSWTYEVDRSIPGIHAGEVASLNALANLAARHARITTFANAQLSRAKVEVLRASRGSKSGSKAKDVDDASVTSQSKLMAPLCATLLDILSEYRQLILDTESDLLRHDASLTDLASLRDDRHNRGGPQDQDSSTAFVSLASIRARFAPWETSLAALDALILALLRGPSQIGFPEDASAPAHQPRTTGSIPRCPTCPTWSAGLLLDMLSLRAHTGIGLVASHLTRLLVACEDYWKRGLVAWMCHGVSEPGASRNGGLVGDVAASASAAVASEPLIEWHDAAADDQDDGAPPLATALDADELDADSTGWRFVRNALPQSIAEDAALSEAILSVGRALSLLAANSRSTSVGASSTLASTTPRSIPASLIASHAARLSASDVRPSRPTAFRRAVMEVREEVGEWMWRNVLTPASVIEAIEALGGYFLHRRGLFVSSLLQELSSLRRHKLLTATSAAGATLQPSDVELALYRASVGTDAEDDAHLELCKVVVAPKRNAGQRLAATRGGSNGSGGGSSSVADAARFDDLALGPSFSLAYTAHFPLDLFLTQRDLHNYSAVFSYLLAIRGAQARLRGCWMDMSKKQRLRRRFTGTGEGGANRAEEKERGELLRMAWGTAREALWFLEALGGHFQTDIIDVQFTRLKDQLQLAQVSSHGTDARSSDDPAWSSDVDTEGGEERIRFPSKLGSLPGSPEKRSVALASSGRIRRSSGPAASARLASGGVAPSVAPSVATWKSRFPAPSRAASISGLRSHAQHHRAPGGGGVHSSTVGGGGSLRPSSAAPQDSALDFASIRAVHSAYLSFVLDGLLLTSPAATSIVRKVLEICDRFVGMVERWGGDVLPDLLMEGSIVGTGEAETVGKSVRERTAKVQEVAQVLRSHLDDFFSLLSSAFEGNLQGSGDVTAGGVGGMDVSLGSLSVLHPATQLTLARAGKANPGPEPGLVKTRSPNFAHDAAPADPKERARAKANEARLDADSAARRHLEQLLLRLDWNDFLGRRVAQAKAGAA